jgi:hypothetical protein
MFNLTKRVSIYFKIKFGPDLFHIINLVNLLNQTEFIDFAWVKFNFTGFKFLIWLNKLDTCKIFLVHGLKFVDEDAIFPKDLVNSDIKLFFFFLNDALMNNQYASFLRGQDSTSLWWFSEETVLRRINSYF